MYKIIYMLSFLLLLFSARTVNAQIQGPTCVNVGQQATYYFDFPNAAQPGFAKWNITKGTRLTSYIIDNQHIVNVSWNQGPGDGKIQAIWWRNGLGPVQYELDVTVALQCITGPPPTPDELNIASSSCTDVEIGIVDTSNGPPNGIQWFWQGKNPNGELMIMPYVNNPTFLATTSGTYYIRSYANGVWGGLSSIDVTIPQAPPIPEPITVSSNTCDAKTLNAINLPDPGTGITWFWQGKNFNGQSQQFNAQNSFEAEESGAYYLRAYNGCFWSIPRGITVQVTAQPLPYDVSGGGVSCVDQNNSFTVFLSGSDLGVKYQLQLDGVNIQTSKNGTNAPLEWTNLSQQGSYGIIASDPDGICNLVMNGSAAIEINSGYCKNYIHTKKPRLAYDQINDIPHNHAKVLESTQYVDGLGRPEQTVLWKNSSGGLDIIQPTSYDAYSRSAVEYLPYTGGTNGGFKLDAIDPDDYTSSAQYQFYQNTDKVATDNSPFAQKVFEQSPLARVIEQGAPGDAWQPSTGRAVKIQYDVNSANDNVRLWDISGVLPQSTQTYAPGSLIKKVTIDEDGNETQEFTDKLGRSILKLEKSLDVRTYYIYDELGNLTWIFPPQMVEEMKVSANYSPSIDLINLWGYQYQFDQRNRMIAKKLPGAETSPGSNWHYMVYDQRDRIVLNQDGNLRADGEWIFTKYDVYNRPILTGKHTEDLSREAMQEKVNTFYNNPGLTTMWYETPLETEFYTNLSFPIVDQENQYLTATFYDEYLFDFFSEFAYTSEFSGQEFLEKPKGQITGTWVRILDDSNDWLKSVDYYDSKYRQIQSHLENILGSSNKVSSSYDFEGNILETKTVHGNREIVHNFDYDHSGNLTKTWHEVFEDNISQGRVLLSQNEYNELGELVDKQLYSQDSGNTFQQSVDYRYNIRGWLQSINNSDLSQNVLNNDDSNDYWGMELAYNQTWTNLDNHASFNGNISAAKWSVNLGLSELKERAYSYEYDAMNRIKGANHAARTVTWSPSIQFTVAGITYDKNGNILDLIRKGSSAADMDELIYSYSGNMLTSVTDVGDTNAGFKDGNTSGDDYSYDPNRNMIEDKNKGITSIEYNYQNLPKKIEKDNGEYLTYTYDAIGNKLSKSVYNSDNSIKKRTDYIGEFIYDKGTLQSIQLEGGRIIVPNAENFTDVYEYQFHLQDHLGNNRVTFTTRERSTEYLATMEDEVEDFEEAIFTNLPETRLTRLAASHSPDQVASVNANNPVGPAMSLEVCAGDVVELETYAYFEGVSGNGNGISTTSMIAAIAASFGGIQGAPGEAGYIFDLFNEGLGILGFGGANRDDVPAGYLNYMVFDKNMIYKDGGYMGISEDAHMSHEKLSFSPILIKEPGFIYVYVTNESQSLNPVYFDDLKVLHKESPIIQSNDYYPFGLSFNSHERPLKVENKFLYNGKEFEEETGWYEYEARLHDPELGRFFSIDPKTEEYHFWSPYVYAGNNPVKFIDVRGEGPAGDGKQNGSGAPKRIKITVIKTKNEYMMSYDAYEISGDLSFVKGKDGYHTVAQNLKKVESSYLHAGENFQLTPIIYQTNGQEEGGFSEKEGFEEGENRNLRLDEVVIGFQIKDNKSVKKGSSESRDLIVPPANYKVSKTEGDSEKRELEGQGYLSLEILQDSKGNIVLWQVKTKEDGTVDKSSNVNGGYMKLNDQYWIKIEIE